MTYIDDLIAARARQAAMAADLRDALEDMLWIAIADEAACCCDPGDPGPHCRAWRALGYRGHFQHEFAARKLTAAKAKRVRP